MNEDSQDNLKSNPVQASKKRFSISFFERLNSTIKNFSRGEKVIFYSFVAIFAISGLTLLWKANNALSEEIPAVGGKFEEGIIGTPRFINPVLAISDADKDLSILIYSGLMRATPDGQLIPDLAEKYIISEDGLTYSFTLKENATFHDGTRITADDVEFTIKKAQDSSIKSPRRANWDGIEMIKISDREINFVLKQPYSSFLENTTLGILPKHIWKTDNPDEFTFNVRNIDPIGSGPYKIRSVKSDSSGLPVYYELVPFKKYASDKALVDINVRFYQNEDEAVRAYKKGYVDSIALISPEKTAEIIDSGAKIETATLPRIFGVFLNQNQAGVFINKEVRVALNEAVDKEAIVSSVLYGYGVPIDGPMPRGILEQTAPTEQVNGEEKIEQAKKTLEDAGWEIDEKTGDLIKKTKKETYSLKFSISTSDVPDLKKIAEILKTTWEKIGAKVEVKIFESSDLNQNVIRPRKYDALLFGEIVGRDLDIFPFWHSSQRNDPGLNIAMYTNITVDKLLESARTTIEFEKRLEKFAEIEKEIKNDIPAIFVYSPEFIYVAPKVVKNADLGAITTPSDRFLNANKWYIETDRVWKIFLK